MPYTHFQFKKIVLLSFIWFFLLIFNSASSNGQATCPVNIDFELGGFQNWQTYTGSVSLLGNKNNVSVSPGNPVAGVHQIIKSDPSKRDVYAPIKLSSPDNSDYIVKLGNDGTGAQAERISYTFTVPQNQNDFVITYQYAVVLEDPGHSPAEQPRFTAKVFDVTTNTYVECGSFDYVATANLPGFKKVGGLIYKDWTPASINLNGFQGHKLRLEFTTADCTASGHFGYAYIDVNNSCSQLITGNDYCPDGPTFTLVGPAGFDKYNWYNADRSKLLGTGVNLVLPTANNNDKTILLDLIPFAGFGCNYTTSTITKALPKVILTVEDPQPICIPLTIDITTTTVIKNKSSAYKYKYWTNAAGSIPLTNPGAITTSGTYYIEAIASNGCSKIQSVNVKIEALPILKITNPATTCLSSPVDLTAPAITVGRSTALDYTYWTDINATQAILNPNAVTKAGTYYIKATNITGCFVIVPVTVNYFPLPVLIINNPQAVCFPGKVDITKQYITAGSDPNLVLTYWTDVNCTIPLLSPDKVASGGKYYIKAKNPNQCETVKSVTVTVNPLPDLNIVTPAEVCYPSTIDITRSNVTQGSNNVHELTYWLDNLATIPLKNPNTVADSGLYYIKATSLLNCEIIKPVLVNIHKLPVLVVTEPKKVYIPYTVDITVADITAGSKGIQTLSYWDDLAATIPVSNPKKIAQSGIYYIKAENKYGCFVIKPVEATVSLVPAILVPKAFTPLQAQNNRLYPFLIGIKTLNSFKIYNRWGALVFQTTDASESSGWDGVYKSQIQFLDVFTWYAEGIDYVGNPVRKSGNTVLLK